MEIKLKSELFKRIFFADSIVTEELSKDLMIPLSEDSQVPKIKSKEVYEDILDDYKNILEAGIDILKISFNNLPNELVKDLLSIGFSAKEMGIFNSEFDFSVLDDVDGTRFESVEMLQFSGLKSKDGIKSKFKQANNLKGLRELNIFGCESLDLDSLFADIPYPENLMSLTISDDLPTPEQIARFKNIRILNIQNIKEPKKLFDFLESAPLENLTRISFIACNLENMPESLILRLSSLLGLELIINENIDYNKILKLLPNKSSLRNLVLNNYRDNNFELDISVLESFWKLDSLALSNFNIDFDKLGVYLERESNLSLLSIFCGNVENLEFLDKARRAVNVNIAQDDIDFKILTPQIARRRSKIYLSRYKTSESVETSFERKDEYDLEPTLDLSMNIKAESLEELKDIIADSNEISDVDIEISDDISLIDDIFLRQIDKVKSGYSVTVSSFSQMSEERVDRLSTKWKLGHIKVIDNECNDDMFPNRFTYTTKQYLDLKKKVKEITEDIPDNLTELQKFMIIYRRLGAMITYDYGAVGKYQYSKYAKENWDNCRNGVNGLIRKTCVCAGYADILYNCLREVGIEAYKISGIGGDYHQWNKVKIDGKFYNADLTWDVADLSRQTNFGLLKWCLRGDEFFKKSHKATAGKSDECLEDFDRKQIREALKFAMEFDGIKPKNIFSVLFNELKLEWRELFRGKQKALPEPSIEHEDNSQLPNQVSVRVNENLNNGENNRPSWDLGDKKAIVQMEMMKTYSNCGKDIRRNCTQSKER